MDNFIERLIATLIYLIMILGLAIIALRMLVVIRMMLRG